MLHTRVILSTAKLREADHQIGVIRCALRRLGIPEVSLSDGSGDESESDETTDDPPQASSDSMLLPDN